VTLRSAPRSAAPALTVAALTAGALTAGGLVAGGLVVAATPALAASPDIVVNEVYGAGGNDGATLTNDFIELRNNGTDTVSLDGWSVQYASATGSSWHATPLAGSIAPGSTYLVQEAKGDGGTQPLPTPDASGTLALSGSTGKVALVTSTTTLICSTGCAGRPGVRDIVAYGPTATGGEGAPAPGLTTSTSASRADGADTDENRADFTAGPPTPQPRGGTTTPPADPPTDPPADALDCTAPAVPIGSVQGTTDTSPLAGGTVTVAGTVVGDLQQGGFNGVFIQDAGDEDPATSDGVFAYRATGDLVPGDQVVARGTVKEYNGLTELDPVTVVDCGDGELPRPAMLPMPSGDTEREALEGMLVAPDAELTVTELFDLSRFGQLLLASGGRLVTPTEAATPGPAAAAVVAENATRSIVLDDGSTATLTGKQPPYLTVDDPVRVGDTAQLQPQVLSYGFGAWLLEPADGTAEGTTFPATNPRPTAVPEVGGDLKVGDFNVLNYFVDFPSEFGDDARGAANAEELAEQQAKIVSAITALDADVLTLHEIENSAVLTPSEPYRAVETLLAAIEAEDGHDWAYVPAHEDTDVITNAIVYRVDRVTPTGAPAVPGDLSAFGNARSPIAQTFDAEGEVFTIIANHLKSKGSSCGAGSDDPSVGGAGNCNGDRVAQAQAVVAFAQERAEAAGDPDVLLTGDFNAYRYEAPIDVVREAGYTDMAPLLAPGEYSYVFDGGSGSLDHVFASPSMAGKLTGLGVWDVNAVESGAYQYDGYEPLYAPNAYRASDHNPTLFGIDVAAAAAISEPRPLRAERVTVTGTGFAPGERVTASLPSRNRGQLGTATADAEGRASITFRVPVVLPAGNQDVQLTSTSGETASTGFWLRPRLEELLAGLTRWWPRG
jgi:5'-nucleotidase